MVRKRKKNAPDVLLIFRRWRAERSDVLLPDAHVFWLAASASDPLRSATARAHNARNDTDARNRSAVAAVHVTAAAGQRVGRQAVRRAPVDVGHETDPRPTTRSLMTCWPLDSLPRRPPCARRSACSTSRSIRCQPIRCARRPRCLGTWRKPRPSPAARSASAARGRRASRRRHP